MMSSDDHYDRYDEYGYDVEGQLTWQERVDPSGVSSKEPSMDKNYPMEMLSLLVVVK